MVKLTAELIEQAAQYTNAVRDRELDLRGESGERAGRPRASPLVHTLPRAPTAGAWPRGLHRGPQSGGLHPDRPVSGLVGVGK